MERESETDAYRCRALCVAVTALAVLALALTPGTLPAAPAQAAPATYTPGNLRPPTRAAAPTLSRSPSTPISLPGQVLRYIGDGNKPGHP